MLTRTKPATRQEELRRNGRIVQSSSRLTSPAAHIESFTRWNRDTQISRIRLFAATRIEKTDLIYSTSGPHAPRVWFVRHWVSHVAEIQKGLSLANCLIVTWLRSSRDSKWSKKGEPAKGQAWDTDRAISIKFPLPSFVPLVRSVLT